MGESETCTAGAQQLNQLSLFLANTRSAKGKTTDITTLTTDFDIICLTETHLDQTIDSQSIIESPLMTIFCKDRNCWGGGVLVGVKSIYEPYELQCDTGNHEMVVVKIDPGLIICCYYRPHISNDLNGVDDIISKLRRQHPECLTIVAGDINLPGIDWETNRIKAQTPYKHHHQHFLDILAENDLTQTICEPTHVHGNTLDLLCVSDPSSVLETQVIIPGLSDHFVVTAEICAKMTVQSKLPICSKTKEIRLFREADVEKFEQIMGDAESRLSDMYDVENMWSLFESTFRKAIEVSVPTKTVNVQSPDQPPWFNKRTKKLVDKQRATYSKYKSTCDPFFLAKHKKERRDHSKIFRKLKRKHITNKVCKPLINGNSKPFYKYLRNKKKEQHPITKLRQQDGSLTADNSKCAGILNLYFQQQFCQDENLDGLTPLPAHIACINIHEGCIKTLIANLKNNKSPGPDKIRKCELLVHPDMVARCLKHIYQASLNTGKLPTAWKLAIISPIHKKGSKEEACNYRPISLTSIPCKMMEHIVLHYLNETLDNLLHNRQHGFRKGLSCETQLCATYHELAKAAEQSTAVHAVVLDFQKAFDKVPHKILMDKIRKIENIDPYIANWVQDFLSDRFQKVAVRGAESDVLPVTSGVPQGSVLGPTLFLLYINDLPDSVSCNVSLYADDTLIYAKIQTRADEIRFQNNIDSLVSWSTKNKMPFNRTKCEVIVFNQGATPLPQYSISDHLLQCVDTTKYLGVVLQSDLKFKKHISDIMGSANRTLGCIKYTLHGAPEKAKLLAYTSLCRPKLEYADVLWDPSDNASIEDLELVQNKAVRFIKNIKGRRGVTEARTSLGIQTLQERRKAHRISLLMRILSDQNKHDTLSADYDEIINCRSQATMKTRAAERGEPTSIQASSAVYHNSFLPRSIRDLRIGSQQN